MENLGNIMDLVLDNIKKLFFPEDWIDIDMEFSKTELLVLLLVHRKGELTMSSLADGINSPMSTASGVADRLVKTGYLARDKCDSDRRLVVVKLTQKGSFLVDRLKELIFEYVNLINESLTGEERDLLVKILFKVMKVLERGVDSKDTKEHLKEKIEKIDIQ
ncbi:MAG: MarR family transcriptional regulator [Clostridia bacterium]|nr:MarR family transcriptional regulator [Clostridia bacterium]